LGAWRISTSLGGGSTVRVEEYKRPTFEASFGEPSAPLRLNRGAKLAGEARYYFGLPVTGGTVRWRVTREPVYPRWWWLGIPREQTQTIASGAGALREDGGFDVAFTAGADERLAKTSREVSYRFTVTADVTDEGGETRTATRTFRLGFVSVEARIDLPQAFFTAGAPAEATVVRSTLDGAPRAGSGSWRLCELRQPERALLPADQAAEFPPAPAGGAEPYRTPGDLLRPRWDAGADAAATLRSWPDGAERARGEATHDATGEAKLALGALPAGAYRLRYRTVDDFGAVCEVAREFVVAGPRTQVALPALLLVETPSVAVGGTARLLALSGLPGQPMFLTIFRGGDVVERRRLTAGADASRIDLPVTEADRGGFGVTLALLRDHQFVELSAQVFVPWDDRKLELSFATFRDRLRPGARETWRVRVKGAAGTGAEAGAAELLAYMYDKSLDLFAPHTPPDPLSLYPARTTALTDHASLGAISGQWFDNTDFARPPGFEAPREDRLKTVDAYGIGGPGRRGVRMMAAAAPGAPQMVAASAEDRLRAAQAGKDEGVYGGIEGGVAGGVPEQAEAAAAQLAAPPPAAPPELRSDFAETAFWQPHLLTGPDGTAAIEFTVPDSVTAWNVWVHAVTRDLKAGSLRAEAKTVKDLMVRPYVPRFLREGDRAEIKVVVNDAADGPLAGTVRLDVVDPDTGASVLSEFGLTPATAAAPFAVKAGGGADLTFAVTAPKRVGAVAFKVVATAGDLSDGELRPLPLLPGRMHLAQSRFVTLHDADHRVMRFEDLAANDDPSRVNEQLVVTVDAQLFTTVLEALPYLVDYPYECTEQTLNRFLATGIVSTLYDQYPAVARLAQQLANRETRLETFDAADPNRRMALEETPWLIEARGGSTPESGLINVLDPRIA
ncbi:MAG TPA: alpha-2-macroglobulin family protein, partial [Thermoanaerobaculaceae bacterium]|nr:alpha-2-macroglobulin family protein [Thermoanaerobaculaceae bacterium]